jgi:hypothetical protein
MASRQVFLACFALFFAGCLLPEPAFSQNAPSNPLAKVAEKCRQRPGITVDLPTSDGVTSVVLCDNELRQYGCRPLALIRNYLLYQNGVCFNRSGMYAFAFSGGACAAPTQQDAPRQRDNYNRVSPQVWFMIRVIQRLELQKTCIEPDGAEQ